MAYVVECEACKSQMTLSEALFERRISGRQVTLRCKHCHHPVVVDGAALRAGGQSPNRTGKAVPPPTSGPAIPPAEGVASAKQQKHYPTLLGFPSVPPPPAMALVPEPPPSPHPAAGGAGRLPKPPVGAAAASSQPPRASIPTAAVAPISQVWGDLGKKKQEGSAASAQAAFQPPKTPVHSAEDADEVEVLGDAPSTAAPIEAVATLAVGAAQGNSGAETQADPTRETGSTGPSNTGQGVPRPKAPSSRKLRARPPSAERAPAQPVVPPPQLGRPGPGAPGDAQPHEAGGVGAAPGANTPNARPVPPLVRPPLPKRVKTTLGMPLVGDQGRAVAEGAPASEPLPPLPIMPPPAPPPRRPDGLDALPAPAERPAAASVAEQLPPPAAPADSAPAEEASTNLEPEPSLTPQPAVGPLALDHRQFLDCPVPPTPPQPPVAASSEASTPSSHEVKSEPATMGLSGVRESHPDEATPDTVGMTEDTTPGFAVGSSDAPSVKRSSRRLRIIGAVGAALAGAAIAAAALLTLAADDATVASVGRAASPTRAEGRTPTAPPAGAQPARPEPSVVPEPAPTPASVESNRAPDVGPGDAPPSPPSSAPAPTEAVPTPPAERQLPGAETIPANVHAPTVLHRIYLAMQRAENCHKGGRAVGTTMVWFTFPTDGSAPEVRLEGEPIASAPVGNCIREEARQVRAPKYEGAPFSVKYKLRLR